MVSMTGSLIKGLCVYWKQDMFSTFVCGQYI